MRYFYVICPVGADPDFVAKKSILDQLGIECDLKPFFPLERHQRFSLREATADIQAAEFVLADLSLERPSCYFELGLTRALGIPISVIAATGTPIHQVGDLDGREIVFYDDLAQYRSALAVILAHPAQRGGR